jgi:hypothetical protein
MASNSQSYSTKSVAQRCQLHRWGRHCDVNDTAVPIWNRCDRGPRIREALAAFKGNINKKNTLTNCITLSHKKFRSDLRIGDFKVEYLREFQAICKKALTRVSGPRGSCLMKKKPGRSKISCYCPFMILAMRQTVDQLKILYCTLYTRDTLHCAMCIHSQRMRSWDLTFETFHTARKSYQLADGGSLASWPAAFT